MSGGVPGAPPVKCFPHSAGVLFAKVGRSDNGPEADRHGGRTSAAAAAHREASVRADTSSPLGWEGGSDGDESRRSRVCGRLRTTGPPAETLVFSSQL